MRSISIVGVGRIGGALAIALSRSGFAIDTLVHRNPSVVDAILSLLPPGVSIQSIDKVRSLASDVILITTSDPDIRTTAKGLADRISRDAVVLHTSGSLSSTELSDLRADGRSLGSLHPLVSISDAVAGADQFAGVYFCVEGDDGAAAVAVEIAEAMGGRPFSIEPENKVLYHAAAVTSAGHVVALVDLAISMLVECGLDRETAKDVLLPLVTSSISNLERQTPERALTGSFARVDVDAVERHLAAFKGPLADQAREIYLLLGEHSTDLAESNGADAEAIRRMRKSISVAKKKSGC